MYKLVEVQGFSLYWDVNASMVSSWSQAEIEVSCFVLQRYARYILMIGRFTNYLFYQVLYYFSEYMKLNSHVRFYCVFSHSPNICCVLWM